MSTSSLNSCASDGTGSISTGTYQASLPRDIPIDKCPRCRVQFDFLKRTNNVSSKVPLILHCRHTVCEDCIRKMCIGTVMECPVCREKFSVARNQLDSLAEIFTPHFSLIGSLLWSKNSTRGPPLGQMNNLVSTGFTWRNKHTLGHTAAAEAVVESEKSDEDCDEIDFDRPMLSLEFEKCSEHADGVRNIHCENCNTTVCCYCFVEEHSKHKPLYLYKFKEEGADLQQLKFQMEVILRQLQMSKKKAKQLKTFDLTSVENDIRNYFSQLHARFHVVEQHIKKKLSNYKPEEADLGVINSTLNSGIFRVKQVLDRLNVINSKQLNMRALYEEVEDLKKLPCRLISDGCTLDPLELCVETDVFENLEDYFVLKKSSGLEYSLLPIDDWSNCHYDQIEENPVPKVSTSQKTAVPKDNRVEAHVSHTVKKEPVGRIRVVVTHINGLNSFYCQRYSVLNALKSMNTCIQKREPRKKLTLNDIQVGNTYGVQCKHSGYWRRAILKNIINKSHDDVLCNMFFVDYGNTQNVTIDKLKELDYHIIKKPPFGFECKLTNPNNTEFGENAHLRLAPIIDDRKELFVHFINRPRSGAQEVDLLVRTSNDGVVSVRNLLSKTAVPAPEKESLILSRNLKLFKNSVKFSVGQEEDVVISHVRDPSHISIQLVSNMDALNKMKAEIKLFYEQQKRSGCCIPVQDTDVIVHYEYKPQGSWHRGKILSVDTAHQRVDVLFVDWGGSATVSWSDIRLLTEKFTRIECQAITVNLTDIERLNMEEPWSQRAVDFINQQISDNNMFRMVVHDAKTLAVALFQERPSADICLNTLLVKEGLAVSTGIISETLYWPKDQESQEDEDNDEFSAQLIKKSEEILSEDEDSELKEGLRPQVYVLSFVSPDLIYIKFAKFKEAEEEMHKELHIHYANVKRNTKNTWRPDEYCVVYDSTRKAYFRGIIRNSCGSNAYMVHLYDHVRDLKVLKNLIYVQEEYFKQLPCYVMKCRLANIKPAGDKGEWSKLAIEMLQKIFSTYKIFHVKKKESSRQQRMLGVIMWYSLTKPAKALEPSKSNFISINKALIQSGVAFGTTTAYDIPNDGDSFINSSAASGDPNTTLAADGRNDSGRNSKDWYQMICEDEELLKSSKETWPKMLPLQNREFDAVLTCVDSEGCFSVRDEDLQDVYEGLENNLNTKFNSLSLPEEEAVEWNPNERCTILFENQWYRGTVLDIINSKEVSVEMIDFGSEHTLSKKQIYKHIMFPDVAPLINKIQLYDVYSTYGNWSADDVDKLLEIVSDRIKVVIKGSLDLEIPFAEIYLPNGLSLNDLISQKCPHVYRLENKVVLGNFEMEDEETKEEESDKPDSDADDEPSEEDLEESDDKDGESMGYTYAPFPDESPCKMYVVSVLKHRSEYRAVLSVSKDTQPDSEELDELNSEIQRDVEQQPLMKKINLHEPCVAYHLQKNMWCRAQIHDVDGMEKGYVEAYFVDYGTLDLVITENLKIMKPKWFKIPVYNRIVIINVELVQNAKAEHALTQMNNLRGKYVTVKFVSYNPTVRVHLCDGKNLCYQNLINYGILKAL